MLAQTAILFLVGPAIATAKLQGWPDEFTILEPMKGDGNSGIDDVFGGIFGSNHKGQAVCEGPDACTSVSSGKCTGTRVFKFGEAGKFLSLQRDGSDPMDLWQTEGQGLAYDMYLKNGDGTVHGQCQPMLKQPLTCAGRAGTDMAGVRMRCKQN